MIANFSNWWDNLSLIEQIYWLVAIPSTLAFVIQLILTFIGGDVDDADMDFDGDMDHDGDMNYDGDSGFHFMTIKNMIAFFSIFSWSGLACIDAELSLVVVVVISVICGLLMMVIMATLYYFMSKLAHSGTLRMNNAINQVGDVYLTIPGGRKGMGKVQVKVQGALRTLDAVTDEPEAIRTGSLIKVVDVINENILVVQRD